MEDKSSLKGREFEPQLAFCVIVTLDTIKNTRSYPLTYVHDHLNFCDVLPIILDCLRGILVALLMLYQNKKPLMYLVCFDIRTFDIFLMKCRDWDIGAQRRVCNVRY